MLIRSAAMAAALFTVAPCIAAPSAPGPSAAPRFAKPITNIPGKSLVAVEVKLPPGGVSSPHHHAKSAFIMAYVIEGAVRNQIAGEPAKVYRAGDVWHEDPGAHHVEAANMSATEPARFLAVFVVDTNEPALTIPDAGPPAPAH